MKIRSLPVDGAHLVEIDLLRDDRGFFARTFDASMFADAGLISTVLQQSVSWSAAAGTLRGIHWQAEPYGEDKLVRCTSGRAFDVLVDVRRGSETYRAAAAVVLDSTEHNAVYVPRGVAHGFLSLTDGTELLYQMSAPYEPSSQRGLRWNDPGLRVDWPNAPVVISSRDSTFPDHSW